MINPILSSPVKHMLLEISHNETFETTDSGVHALSTDRLLLRVPAMSDLADYAALLADKRVMQFVGLESGRTFTSDESMENLASAIQAWRVRGYGRWSIFSRSNGDFIGFVGFRCEAGKPEFVAVLKPEYWGRGMAVEAARKICDYGFSELGFEDVHIFCRPNHFQARRVMEKLGAESIGPIRFHGVEGAAYLLKPSHLT